MRKYVTAEQLIKLTHTLGINKSNLTLTYLDNYSRIIPKDAASKIKNALDLTLENGVHVFDNVVILSLNHKGVSELTEKEKDPIAFGVIEKSDKLYFIADWIDEYCSLTLESLIEEYKVEVNSISLN